MSVGSPPRAPIRRLDAATVVQIAAGEVVERPASVVKELVENAYDAGSTEVAIRLARGGLELIEVADDGAGIPPDELLLAVERHATSKLETAEELRAIRTLGFRGEALASIGAVSHLRVLSRPAGEPTGRGLSVVAGAPAGTFLAGRAVGTTVEVRELFFNVPARLKFLHAPAAEQLEVIAMADRLYLSHPGVGLSLEADGREICRYPAANGLADAAARVFGPEFLKESFRVEAESPDGLRIEGTLSRPSISRGGANGVHFAVNGRAVSSRPLQQAVRQAYLDYLPRTRYPMGAVHLLLPAEQVDVNVHPTKREVRIARERDVADFVRRTVRAALQGGRQVASAGPLRATRRAAAASPAPPATAPSATSPARFRPPLLAAAPALVPRTLQRTIDEAPNPLRAVPGTARHPKLRLLGAIFELYWLAESDEGLVVIDQHAASERLLYDTLLRSGQLARQELVTPWRLTLTSRQAATLETEREPLRSAGFLVEPFGGADYRVLSVPAYRGLNAHPDSLPALLDELSEEGEGSRGVSSWVERRAASVACHAAVRAGDPISTETMARMLEELYQGPEEAYACPHGRPILVAFSRSRLDRLFLRSGA